MEKNASNLTLPASVADFCDFLLMIFFGFLCESALRIGVFLKTKHGGVTLRTPRVAIDEVVKIFRRTMVKSLKSRRLGERWLLPRGGDGGSCTTVDR